MVKFQQLRRYDAETRADFVAGPTAVDHAASVLSNLEAAGMDLLLTAFPDNTIRGFLTGVAEGLWTGRAGRSMLLETAKGLGADLLDLVTGPAYFVKDVSDAALHAIAAGFSD